MCIEDAAKLGDISISYWNNDKVMGTGWYWALECGYQSWQSHDPKSSALEAHLELLNFLMDWKGPTK